MKLKFKVGDKVFFYPKMSDCHLDGLNNDKCYSAEIIDLVETPRGIGYKLDFIHMSVNMVRSQESIFLSELEAKNSLVADIFDEIKSRAISDGYIGMLCDRLKKIIINDN